MSDIEVRQRRAAIARQVMQVAAANTLAQIAGQRHHDPLDPVQHVNPERGFSGFAASMPQESVESILEPLRHLNAETGLTWAIMPTEPAGFWGLIDITRLMPHTTAWRMLSNSGDGVISSLIAAALQFNVTEAIPDQLRLVDARARQQPPQSVNNNREPRDPQHFQARRLRSFNAEFNTDWTLLPDHPTGIIVRNDTTNAAYGPFVTYEQAVTYTMIACWYDELLTDTQLPAWVSPVISDSSVTEENIFGALGLLRRYLDTSASVEPFVNSAGDTHYQLVVNRTAVTSPLRSRVWAIAAGVVRLWIDGALTLPQCQAIRMGRELTTAAEPGESDNLIDAENRTREVSRLHQFNQASGRHFALTFEAGIRVLDRSSHIYYGPFVNCEQAVNYVILIAWQAETITDMQLALYFRFPANAAVSIATALNQLSEYLNSAVVMDNEVTSDGRRLYYVNIDGFHPTRMLDNRQLALEAALVYLWRSNQLTSEQCQAIRTGQRLPEVAATATENEVWYPEDCAVLPYLQDYCEYPDGVEVAATQLQHCEQYTGSLWRVSIIYTDGDVRRFAAFATRFAAVAYAASQLCTEGILTPESYSNVLREAVVTLQTGSPSNASRLEIISEGYDAPLYTERVDGHWYAYENAHVLNPQGFSTEYSLLIHLAASQVYNGQLSHAQFQAICSVDPEAPDTEDPESDTAATVAARALTDPASYLPRLEALSNAVGHPLQITQIGEGYVVHAGETIHAAAYISCTQQDAITYAAGVAYRTNMTLADFESLVATDPRSELCDVHAAVDFLQLSAGLATVELRQTDYRNYYITWLDREGSERRSPYCSRAFSALVATLCEFVSSGLLTANAFSLALAPLAPAGELPEDIILERLGQFRDCLEPDYRLDWQYEGDQLTITINRSNGWTQYITPLSAHHLITYVIAAACSNGLISRDDHNECLLNDPMLRPVSQSDFDALGAFAGVTLGYNTLSTTEYGAVVDNRPHNYFTSESLYGVLVLLEADFLTRELITPEQFAAVISGQWRETQPPADSAVTRAIQQQLERLSGITGSTHQVHTLHDENGVPEYYVENADASAGDLFPRQNTQLAAVRVAILQHYAQTPSFTWNDYINVMWAGVKVLLEAYTGNEFDLEPDFSESAPWFISELPAGEEVAANHGNYESPEPTIEELVDQLYVDNALTLFEAGMIRLMVPSAEEWDEANSVQLIHEDEQPQAALQDEVTALTQCVSDAELLELLAQTCHPSMFQLHSVSGEWQVLQCELLSSRGHALSAHPRHAIIAAATELYRNGEMTMFEYDEFLSSTLMSEEDSGWVEADSEPLQPRLGDDEELIQNDLEELAETYGLDSITLDLEAIEPYPVRILHYEMEFVLCHVPAPAVAVATVAELLDSFARTYLYQHSSDTVDAYGDQFFAYIINLRFSSE